ncbi:gamma-glutamylcyclotransferase family protein [Ectobacillus ponti]|uniref:Gamma-glutamylcyclotransferase family protein n=1 Tax=Ectobacillus ponti TaxID=2961894 RepID=A0AA42BR54_9BACI|nr:gamma-glutamylcyclotransferase family protein [Ectobacillus ponti]MCP8970061.1 gamma-glutamylcyclotransferase [Ectobacillus ponti]
MLLFVYGTLRKDEHNHHYLEGAECVAEVCWTAGRLHDTGLGYPALEEAEGQVYGELYRITEAHLPAIDELEDYVEGSTDNLYERVTRQIMTETGAHEAFVYVIHPNYRHLLQVHLAGGDWRKR